MNNITVSNTRWAQNCCKEGKEGQVYSIQAGPEYEDG